MRKSYVIQIVSNIDPDDVRYRDVVAGDCESKEEAEGLISDLVKQVPLFDYRIDERYVR